MALVPSTIFEKDVVHDLVNAADWIKDNNVKIDFQLLADLKLAISVRKRYTKHFVDGGDEGHSYFLLVLNYCFQTLRYCQQLGASTNDEEVVDDQGNENEMSNRFASLGIDEDSDEEAEDEEEEKEVIRPQEPSKPFSFDDFYSVPDTAKAQQFLDTISYHTVRAIQGFRNVKETMRLVASGEFQVEKVAKELVCIGVILNMAILNVKHLEDSLAVECPHLNSSYRILACAFLAPGINMIKETVRKYFPVAKKFEDHMALAFVADIVEAVFRGRVDLQEHVSKIASQFCRRWKLPQHWTEKTEWLAGVLIRVTLEESLTEFEKQTYKSAPLRGLGDPMPWFDGFEVWVHAFSWIGS